MATESATSVHAPNAALYQPSQLEQALMLRALDDPYAAAASFAAGAQGNRLRSEYQNALTNSNTVARALAERKLMVDMQDKLMGHANTAFKIGAETGALPVMAQTDILKQLFAGAPTEGINGIGGLGQAKARSEIFKNVVDPWAAANREGVNIDPSIGAVIGGMPAGSVTLGDPAQVRAAGINANGNNEPKITVKESPLGGSEVSISGRAGSIGPQHADYARSLIKPARDGAQTHNGGTTKTTPQTPTKDPKVAAIEARNPGYTALPKPVEVNGQMVIGLVSKDRSHIRYVNPVTGASTDLPMSR